ncbi:MAG: hypothetical protein NVS9B10_01810 [Nevskia sp.]
MQLQAAIVAMQSGDYAAASHQLEALLKRQPNFRLANLLYGQVLALRSGAKIGLPLTDDHDPRLRELLDELHARTDAGSDLPPAGTVPSVLVRLAEQVRHVLVVDLSKARLYLIANERGGPHLLRSYYAGIARNGFGKQTAGDLRTPVGVYHVTGWTPGSQLPPFYGAGAFPVNYPNSWDRSLGKSGSGIWLHGVPANTYVRAPRSSEGCVTLANEDLLALRQVIAAGSTPVILADRIDWLPAAKLAAERETLMRTIENWRAKWSMLDTSAYLGHYAADFQTDDGLNKTAFSEYKRRVNAGKKRVEIRISELSLFAYPGETGLVVAKFQQDYKSDNFITSSRKDQYWRQQANGEWKIVREENR